jgi:tetratricopeptide (TPR) repeat protein
MIIGNRVGAILFIGIILVTCTIGSADNFQAVQNYNQAVDLAYQGKYTDALEYIDRALEENNNFTLAFITRAGILNALGRYPEAVQAADQAIALNPEQADAWNNKASALNQMQRFEEGLVAADRATALDPNLTEAWVNKGTALIELKRYSEAISASEQALAQDPGSEAAQQNLETAQRGLSPNPTQALIPITTILMAVVFGIGLLLLKKI